MEVLPSDIQSLPQLCAANTDKHINSLLYIEMINESGHQVTGHVDLADKVSNARERLVELREGKVGPFISQKLTSESKLSRQFQLKNVFTKLPSPGEDRRDSAEDEG